jgi:hypothetical protein
MKKTIALLLACILCLALFAACGKTETPAEPQENADVSLAGDYMNDRCSVTIAEDGENGFAITAYWGETAKDGFNWTLTGTYDAAAKRINYTDAKKESVTYTDVGVFDVNEVVFENGTGYIQVNDDGSLTWNDAQDADMAFEPLERVANEDEAEPQRTLKDFVGSYSADRCTIVVEATSDTDGTISVHWGSSVSDAYEWTMTGYFDGDTMRMSYSDGVKKYVVFNEDGTLAEETVEYENGCGRLQFFGDGTLRWEDEQEADNLVGMTFEKLPA